ncbi:hypothetical protein CSHISOI_08601 [Colletotrichum shisoi]|uniref:Uncharacterized protein n=1 Tax=Colletotrichum shisoi TaxID=2078593 RepID=A0A5Q4BIT1_9PEZI|nr:hypothetical protein CSHISOI_08601 [Colletotrichum shisoi]
MSRTSDEDIQTGRLPLLQTGSSPVQTMDDSVQPFLDTVSVEPDSPTDPTPVTGSDSGPDEPPEDLLASQQKNGLDGLRARRDRKLRHIQRTFDHQRARIQQYFARRRAEATDEYESGLCDCRLNFLSFRRSLQLELEEIREQEQNGIIVLLEGERIERGAAERWHDGREKKYIQECREEWAQKCPATPFWYEGPGAVSQSAAFSGV